MSGQYIKDLSKLDAYQRALSMKESLDALEVRNEQSSHPMALRTFEEKMRLYPDEFCPKAPVELKQSDGWVTHVLEYGPGFLSRVFQTKQYCIFCGHTEAPMV